MYFTLLNNRALLLLSGADTDGFLQGLISNDIAKLKDGRAMYAAMLTPQGKFLHDFFLMRREGGIVLDCDGTRVDDLRKRFSLYKLRADVQTEHLDGEGVVAVWQENSLPLEGEGGAERRVGAQQNNAPLLTSPLEGGGILADPRLPEMGFRAVGNIQSIMQQCKTNGWEVKTFADYEAHRLALSIPDGAQDAILERSFLLELGFDALHGVDFNKGCYVGQEVTARSKFRGQVRKHLYRVQGEAELPAPGTSIMQHGAAVGELRSHAGATGLAIIRTEAVEKAEPLSADGMIISASWPKWAHPLAA